MGRTLDILKHTRASPVSRRIAPQVPPTSSPAILPLSESAEEVPFVEVGGPNHELHGSAAVLAKPAPGKKVLDSNPDIKKDLVRSESRTTISSSVLVPPASILDFPLSVAFQPL